MNNEIRITLDKPRSLKLTMKAWEYLENVYGTVQEAITTLQGQKVRALVDFIYAGCIHEDANLTRDTVANSFGLEDVPGLTDQLIRAVKKSLPKTEDEEGETADPQ